MLLWLWCQGFWEILDQKEYLPSEMLFAEYPKQSSLSINKQGRMVGYRDTSDIAKIAAEVAQKKEQ